MSVLGASAIAAGGALLGTGANAMAQGKMNKRAERFSKWMWEQQGDRELAYWNMQNEYNLPANQMQRLQEGGLNPHLFYGSGSQSVQSAPLSSKGGTSTPNFQAPKFDLGSVVQQAMSTKAMEAQIARTEAETERIQTSTLEGQFDLAVKRSVGLDTMSQQLNAKTQSLTAQARKELMDFDGYVRAVTDYKGDIDANLAISTGDFDARSNRLIEQAQKAGLQSTIQNLQNLKKAGILRDDQHTLNQIDVEIRDFTKRLSNMGISPQSTQALQVLVTLLKSIFGN